MPEERVLPHEGLVAALTPASHKAKWLWLAFVLSGPVPWLFVELVSTVFIFLEASLHCALLMTALLSGPVSSRPRSQAVMLEASV